MTYVCPLFQSALISASDRRKGQGPLQGFGDSHFSAHGPDEASGGCTGSKRDPEGDFITHCLTEDNLFLIGVGYSVILIRTGL